MTTPSERLFFTWFLSGTDNQDHAVVDEEFARAFHNGSGLCEALCGHLVLPRSLTAPPGPRCARCLLFVRARATLSDPDLRMANQPAAIARRLSFVGCSAALSDPPPARLSPGRIGQGQTAAAPPLKPLLPAGPPRTTPDLGLRNRRPPPPKGATSTKRSNNMATPISAANRSDFDKPDLATEANFFSEHMGWPVSIDVKHQRLVVHTGDVLDALVLPRSLAEPVALELSSSLMAGPVSRDNRDRWWTFITEPCQRQNVELPHDLRAKRVHAVPSGGQLVIPPIAETTSWWQQPQPSRLLPPWSAVVAIARRVINRGR